MTRTDDVAKIVAPYLDDRHGEPEAKALHIARALDAAGHLMLDLPEPDVITPRTETNPAPIGLWNTDHPSVTGSPSAPPVVFVDEYTDLPPDEARAYAYAILAAADYAEEHTNDQ